MLDLVFISPAIIIQYVLQHDDFGSTFRFGEVFGIARDCIGDILMVILVTMGIGLGVSVVLGVLQIIPCVGQILALVIGLLMSPYLTAVTGHLYGQIAMKFVGGTSKEEKFSI